MVNKAIVLFTAFIGTAVASPIVETSKTSSPAWINIATRAWPSGTVTCGSNDYDLDALKAAVSTGFEHIDSPLGDNSYPHAFNNYEGLELYCSGKSKYSEFPIMASGEVYNGESPDTDRVIFSSDDGTYCATVTHTGASGNDFVSCQGD
jgi:hypothetical protein